jgi:hypothetical protein
MELFRWLRLAFALFDRAGRFAGVIAAFFLVGLALSLAGAIFGFDLGNVDRWLERHEGFIGAAGDLLFRIGCGFVLLVCVATLAGAIFGRRSPDPGPGEPPRDLLAPEPRAAAPGAAPGEEPTDLEPPPPPGWGCALLAIPVGWFAWIGMTMP